MRIGVVVAVMAAVGMAAGCAPQGNVAPAGKPGLVHAVFFWSKDGVGDDAKAEMIKDGYELLGKVPSVRKVLLGKPAMTPGGLVDHGYTFALLVYFDDKEGLAAYEKHALHLDYVKKHKEKWGDIKVYDFLIQ